jgi:ABC-2 type transport system permease protein
MSAVVSRIAGPSAAPTVAVRLAGGTFGGATVATFQGVVIVVLAGAVGAPYDPGMIFFTLLGELLLLAFTLTSFGVMAAARIQQIESCQMVMQFLVLPMFFLSGAVFRLSHLPGWLRILTRIDPVSYAVDPMRRAVFANLRLPAGVLHEPNPGLTWMRWRVPTLVELALVLTLGAAMLLVAVWEFSRPE